MAEFIKTNKMTDDEIIGNIPTVINENNEILESAINNLLTTLDTELSVLTVKEGKFFNGENPIDTTLISTNGNIEANKIALTGAISAQSMALANGFSLTDGDLTIASTESKIDLAGNILIGGELVLQSYDNTPVNASYELTFVTQEGNDLILEGETIVGGLISPKNQSIITLDWSQYVAGSENTTKTYLTKILLGTENITTGHILHVVSNLGTVTGVDFYLLKNTIAYSNNAPLTTGVKFTDSYQVASFAFDGTNWVILNLKGAVEE